MKQRPVRYVDGVLKGAKVRVRMTNDLVRVLRRIAGGMLVTAEIDKAEKPTYRSGKRAGQPKKGWASACAKRLALLSPKLVERLGPGVYQATRQGREHLQDLEARERRAAEAPKPEERLVESRRAHKAEQKGRRKRIFEEREKTLPTTVDGSSKVEIAARHDDRGTPERAAKGEVKETKITELDRVGREQTIGRAARAADTLDIMLRSRTIEAEWYAAGRQFQIDFRHAHLDPAKAQNLYRVPGGGGGGDITELIEYKRRAVHRAMEVLGGRSTPVGQIVWHVLGEQLQISEWAAGQKRESGSTMNVTRASGLLCGALALLARHYERSAPATPRAGEKGVAAEAPSEAVLAAKPKGKAKTTWGSGWPP